MTGNTWPVGLPGVLALPSGLLIRGRGLRQPAPPGPDPTWALHLTGRRPPEPPWEREWLRWRDFWVPSDPDAVLEAIRRAHCKAGIDRVEIACSGGVGRTGTALAALCVLEGEKPSAAVAWVRRHYHPKAVETPWQRALLASWQRYG